MIAYLFPGILERYTVDRKFYISQSPSARFSTAVFHQVEITMTSETSQAPQEENFFKQAWASFTSILPFSSDNEVPDEVTGLTKDQKDHIRKAWGIVCTMKTKFGVTLFVK